MVDALTPKQMSAIQRAVRKPELQPLLFRKVKGLIWFDPFYKQGFFKVENNPKPLPAKEEGFINIPFWSATEYLVNVSSELSAPGNEDYANKFIELIRAITVHAKKENFSNYRTWWQLAKVIRNIPVHFIRTEDINLIDYWMDDPFERGLVAEEIGEQWLPKLLDKTDEHSRQIALRLLDCLYKIVLVDKKIGSSSKKELVLRFDSYRAENLAKKGVARLSGLKLGLPAVEVFQNRLVLILDGGDHDSWSAIWRKAIEEHDQNGRLNDTDDGIVAAYRDCLMGFIEQNRHAAMDYVRSLFGSRYNTLKRVAIYAVDKRYAALKELGSAVLESRYFHDNYRHELWQFLANHYGELSLDQQNSVIETIQGLEVHDEGVGLSEKATAYKRAIWMSAIKHYDDKLAQLYKTYTDIVGAEPEHPDFSSYMSVGSVEHKSPISIENLLSLDADTLVKTINNYEDTGRVWYDEPGLEGLVKTFKEVVKSKPIDIYRELVKFADSKLSFIHPLIEAYRELWNEKKDMPWNDVWPHLLGFCLELIKRDNFWSDDSEKKGSHFTANRHWIVGAIGQLIEDGTKSDDHAFDRRLAAQAKDIIVILLDRQEGEEFKPDSDAVFIAINSPRGRCIEALIVTPGLNRTHFGGFIGPT